MQLNYGGRITCGPMPKPYCWLDGPFSLNYWTKPAPDDHPGTNCPDTYDMGTDLMIALNKLAVRVGAQAALQDADYLESHLDAGLSNSVTTTTHAIPTGPRLVYQMNHIFFAGAGTSQVYHTSRFNAGPLANNLPLRIVQ